MNKTWQCVINNFPSDNSTAACRITIPVARKGCKKMFFSVERPDGSVVSAQSRVLVSYPDGSPRWIQLDFEGNGNGCYTIRNAPAEEKGKELLKLKKILKGFSVETRGLKVKILKRKWFPISSIIFNQQNLLAENNEWKINAKTGGKIFEYTTDTSSFKVESEGERRFQVSWIGHLIEKETGEKLLDVKCRIEFLAGIQGFSLSIQLFHCLVKKPFLNIDSIMCNFSMPSLDKTLLCQESYSNLAIKRIVEIEKDIEIFLDKTRFFPYVENLSALKDNFEYPVFLRDSNQNVAEAIWLKNDYASACVCMRDFVHHRPKKVKVEKGNICYQLWPEFAGVLNLQQGSNYRVLFDFIFTDQDKLIEKSFKQLQSIRVEPCYGWLEKHSFADVGETFHQWILFSEKDSGLFSWLLSSATARFHTVSEMFHYGDTFDEGYSHNYFSHARYPQELKPSGILFNTSGGIYRKPQEPQPVWANNEYDAIYCLCLEAMRTKNASVVKRLVAAARHQIETDFVYYSDHWQQHRTCPQHSYGHIRMMSSLPSHQWTQGLYHYYVLTGDDDAPDVIKAICNYDIAYFEKIPHQFNKFFNREYGWAILALVYGFEATGNIFYIERAESMIKQLEKNTAEQDARDAFGKGFACNTVLLGLMAYHQATRSRWARKLFLKWLEYGMKNFIDKKYGPRITELFIEPLAYAYFLTGNKRYLVKSLWHLELFLKGWNDLGWLSGLTTLTTKKYARVYRGLIHFFFACNRAKLLSKLDRVATRNNINRTNGRKK
ncbi:MAG: hypothetical protein NC830_07035 [Candidatus Omnitrophica bacterium]|nr:hypothetical protein [Candidatus Omnitrophota bacterium]